MAPIPRAAAAGDDAPAGELLTVERAVALALERNPHLRATALDVERARHRLASAKTRYYPTLSLESMSGTLLNSVRVDFPEGAFGTFPGTGPIPAEDTTVEAARVWSGRVTASIAQPITDLRRLRLNTRLNQLGLDLERTRLASDRAALAAATRRLYYAILRDQSAVRTAAEQVDDYRELDRVVGERVALETALAADGLEVKARLASAELQLQAARNQLALDRDRLLQTMGRAPGEELDVQAMPEPESGAVELEPALAHALASRHDLKAAELHVASAATSRQMKQAESIPSVSVALSYDSFFNVELLPRGVSQVGLQVKWEPFDWGRKGRERAERTLELEQARLEAQQAADGARIEVAQRVRAVAEARLRIVAGRLGREAARERLKVATARHRVEAALLHDVLDAQADMSTASDEHDQALLAYWTASADLREALGEEE